MQNVNRRLLAASEIRTLHHCELDQLLQSLLFESGTEPGLINQLFAEFDVHCGKLIRFYYT